MFRRLTATLRDWLFVIRDWLADWYELFTTPVRSFRPRHFASDLLAASKDALSLAWAFMRGTVSTIVGFVGFLFMLPVQAVRSGRQAAPFAWWWLRTRSWRQLAVLGLAVVLSVGSVAGTGFYLLREHRRDFQRTLLWRQYDAALDAGQADKMESILIDLQRLAPSDAIVAQRLANLHTRAAPSSDLKFLRFLMRLHSNEGRPDLSAREAAKVIEAAPEDYEARYYLIADAVQRDDREAVQKHLAALPAVKDAGESLPPYIALFAANLFQRLGERARYDDVVEYIVQTILPVLRRDDLPNLGPDAIVLLVNCFHQTVPQLERYPRLTQYWVPVRRACRSVLENPDTSLRTLAALGALLERQLAIVQEFAQLGKIDAGDYKSMSAEVEDEIGHAWEKVLGREPNNVLGFVGLAYHKARTGGLAAGVQLTAKGLDVCGPKPELIEALAKLLRESDPQAGLRFLQQMVPEEGMTPRMCQVVADVARQAGRPDVALGACRRALLQDSTLVWARSVEGDICLELGKPTEAATALKPIRTELAKSPIGCALYVRVLCACGSYQLAEEFLEQVKAENRPNEALLQAALAMQQANRPEDAVRWARQVLERNSFDIRALLLVADNLRQLAGRDEHNWDRDRVRESLQVYRAVLRQQPKNLTAVNNVVWLQLKALQEPQDAFEASAPLREVENEVGIPADFLETLGAVYVAVGRYGDARRVLDAAVSTAGPRPGYYTHLALAHHGLKHAEMAEYYLNAAARMSKGGRELAEWTEAARVIHAR